MEWEITEEYDQGLRLGGHRRTVYHPENQMMIDMALGVWKEYYAPKAFGYPYSHTDRLRMAVFLLAIWQRCYPEYVHWLRAGKPKSALGRGTRGDAKMRGTDHTSARLHLFSLSVEEFRLIWWACGIPEMEEGSVLLARFFSEPLADVLVNGMYYRPDDERHRFVSNSDNTKLEAKMYEWARLCDERLFECDPSQSDSTMQLLLTMKRGMDRDSLIEVPSGIDICLPAVPSEYLPTETHTGSFVYFLFDFARERVKIGSSSCPAERADDLGATPGEIMPMQVLGGGSFLEKWIHRTLGKTGHIGREVYELRVAQDMLLMILTSSAFSEYARIGREYHQEAAKRLKDLKAP